MMRMNKIAEITAHLMVWIILLGFPFFFISRQSINIYWDIYISFMAVPLSWMIVFYLNYLWLVPRIMFKQRTRTYLIANAIIIAVLGLGLHEAQNKGYIGPRPYKETTKKVDQQESPPTWFFFSRDLLTLILSAGLGATIRMSTRWREAEVARQEAEKNKTEAELKNLKNQLNPHFLLNTLNNIYALIAFDSNKAQEAVHDLSKLLRYMLYDNQSTRVPLNNEADFIRNYIELMRIRLSSNVTVETHIDIALDTHTVIAPLIYISLIENAFKHGVSPSQKSYVRIKLYEEKNGQVVCEIRNSNFPKTYHDKSGHGIGLEQVAKRLDFIYKGKYRWEKGVEDKEYRSLLVIDTN
jgi:two-component sensor histidine kinase